MRMVSFRTRKNRHVRHARQGWRAPGLAESSAPGCAGRPPISPSGLCRRGYSQQVQLEQEQGPDSQPQVQVQLVLPQQQALSVIVMYGLAS